MHDHALSHFGGSRQSGTWRRDEAITSSVIGLSGIKPYNGLTIASMPAHGGACSLGPSYPSLLPELP